MAESQGTASLSEIRAVVLPIVLRADLEKLTAKDVRARVIQEPSLASRLPPEARLKKLLKGIIFECMQEREHMGDSVIVTQDTGPEKRGNSVARVTDVLVSSNGKNAETTKKNETAGGLPQRGKEKLGPKAPPDAVDVENADENSPCVPSPSDEIIETGTKINPKRRPTEKVPVPNEKTGDGLEQGSKPSQKKRRQNGKRLRVVVESSGDESEADSETDSKDVGADEGGSNETEGDDDSDGVRVRSSDKLDATRKRKQPTKGKKTLDDDACDGNSRAGSDAEERVPKKKKVSSSRGHNASAKSRKTAKEEAQDDVSDADDGASQDSSDLEERTVKRKKPQSSRAQKTSGKPPTDQRLAKALRVARQLGLPVPPSRLRCDPADKLSVVRKYLLEKGIDSDPLSLNKQEIASWRDKVAREKELADLDTANIITSGEGRSRRNLSRRSAADLPSSKTNDSESDNNGSSGPTSEKVPSKSDSKDSENSPSSPEPSSSDEDSADDSDFELE